MKQHPVSKTSRIVIAIVALGILAVISLFFLPKKATAPVAGFRDCVRRTKIVHASAEGGHVCRLPDETELMERAGGESDLPVSSFRTADDMISGSNEREDKVITTTKGFETLWQQLFGQMDLSQVPEKPTMEADYFDHSTVIALFAGLKGSGGHSIQPLMVWEESDRVEIVVKETAPDGPALTVITTPYSLFSIPNKNKPVTFIHVTDADQPSPSEKNPPETRY